MSRRAGSGGWLCRLRCARRHVSNELHGDETALSRYFDRNRERKGFQALTEGLLALAAGEGRLALNRAIKAEKYLAEPHLTTLLVAQAAEAAGDTRRGTPPPALTR